MKLSRILRRDPAAPTLRERAADLRVGLARALGSGRSPGVAEPTPKAEPVPRAALSSYATWLKIEADRLVLEMLPGSTAGDTEPAVAACDWHLRATGDPKPSNRAVMILDMLGVAWRTDVGETAPAVAPQIVSADADGSTSHAAAELVDPSLALAATEGRILAGSGIDHYDGTMTYCDAIGTVARRSVAQWIAFTAMQMHAKVQAEIARQRIGANALPNDEHEAWEARVRRDLRADAVFALAFHPGRAFAAEEARRHGGEPVDWYSPPPGFMAHPAIDPQGFVNIPEGIRLDLERLHGIADVEYERRVGPETTAEDAERLRRQLRLDVLGKAARGDGGFMVSPVTPSDDATLIALEAEFLAKDAVFCAAVDAAGAALIAYDEPAMPTELRVWRNDWVFSDIPRTPTDPLPDGRARVRPYGKHEVEIMRVNLCMVVCFGGTEGEPLPNGGRRRPDPTAQARADAIVAAWDAWQARITAAREALSLPALTAAREAACEARNAVLQRVRETPARGLAGLAVKARIAANMACERDISASGLELYDPDDGDAFLYSLAGDLIALTGGMPASHGMED